MSIAKTGLKRVLTSSGDSDSGDDSKSSKKPILKKLKKKRTTKETIKNKNKDYESISNSENSDDDIPLKNITKKTKSTNTKVLKNITLTDRNKTGSSLKGKSKNEIADTDEDNSDESGVKAENCESDSEKPINCGSFYANKNKTRSKKITPNTTNSNINKSKKLNTSDIKSAGKNSSDEQSNANLSSSDNDGKHLKSNKISKVNNKMANKCKSLDKKAYLVSSDEESMEIINGTSKSPITEMKTLDKIVSSSNSESSDDNIICRKIKVTPKRSGEMPSKKIKGITEHSEDENHQKNMDTSQSLGSNSSKGRTKSTKNINIDSYKNSDNESISSDDESDASSCNSDKSESSNNFEKKAEAIDSDSKETKDLKGSTESSDSDSDSSSDDEKAINKSAKSKPAKKNFKETSDRSDSATSDDKKPLKPKLTKKSIDLQHSSDDEKPLETVIKSKSGSKKVRNVSNESDSESCEEENLPLSKAKVRKPKISKSTNPMKKKALHNTHKINIVNKKSQKDSDVSENSESSEDERPLKPKSKKGSIISKGSSSDTNSSDDEKPLLSSFGIKPKLQSKNKQKEDSEESESSDDEKKKSKKSKEKPEVIKKKPIVDQLAPIKRKVRAMGLHIQSYDKFFVGCKSIKAKKEKLIEYMREHGLKGVPTLEKCKKLKEKIERKKEIAELDLGNIIESGRGRRNVRSLYSSSAPQNSFDSLTQRREKTLSRIKRFSDSDTGDEIDEDITDDDHKKDEDEESASDESMKETKKRSILDSDSECD